MSYFKRLADLDVKVLEALIAGSVDEVKRRYPNPATPNHSFNRTRDGSGPVNYLMQHNLYLVPPEAPMRLSSLLALNGW